MSIKYDHKLRVSALVQGECIPFFWTELVLTMLVGSSRCSSNRVNDFIVLLFYKSYEIDVIGHISPLYSQRSLNPSYASYVFPVNGVTGLTNYSFKILIKFWRYVWLSTLLDLILHFDQVYAEARLWRVQARSVLWWSGTSFLRCGNFIFLNLFLESNHRLF